MRLAKYIIVYSIGWFLLSVAQAYINMHFNIDQHELARFISFNSGGLTMLLLIKYVTRVKILA